MKFNQTHWSVPVILVFCVTALAQAHLPVSRSNYKTNSFATVAAREAVNTQANLQLIEVLESGKEVTGSIPTPVPGNCGISRTQYRFSGGFSPCGGGSSLAVTIRADQNVNVLIRKDRPVTVENGVFMYDQMSENQVKVHNLGGFQPTPGTGTFFIAVLNCGFEPVNYAVTTGLIIAEPSLFISNVFLKKKKLHVIGALRGATVLINGQPQKTINDGQDENFLDVLIVKNAKKKLPRNQFFIILATRPGGCSSNSFIFIRH